MIISSYQIRGKSTPGFIAGFDSATSMLISLSHFLKGKDFKGTGAMPSSELLATIVNALPAIWKERLYSASGPLDAVFPHNIKNIDTTEFDQWVTQSYPKRNYPVIAIGASNGALVHLYAALGIPWLPQSFLIPITKPNLHHDVPKKTMEWAVRYADQLLKNNPDVVLHHMTDPNQDRLHLSYITYFRTKKIKLGKQYEQFIKGNLSPGGTLLVIDCQYKWPTVRIDDRHVFQFGGSGGATPEEYYNGSERITQLLKKYNSPYSAWDAPQPDGESPEAEWGFAPELMEDVQCFAKANHYKVQKVTFKDPHDPSPLVADLYRNWYRQRGMLTNQLLIECFAVHEPYWSLRTGSVPFWMVFNTEPSADAVERYLQNTTSYDDIYLMLLSHGTESVGLASIDRWNSILSYAKQKSGFIGVDTAKYPRDFGVYMRYNKALQKNIPSRYPLLPRLQISYLHEFLRKNPGRYKVDWPLSDQSKKPLTSEKENNIPLPVR